MDKLEPRVRSRRALDVGDDTEQEQPQASEAMHIMARRIYRANQAKNKFSRVEEKAKKDLAAAMAKVKGLRKFLAYWHNKTLRVEYAAPKTTTVDVVALAAKVGAEKVLPLCSISQKAVEETFGTNVLTEHLVSATGDMKVTVKEEK